MLCAKFNWSWPSGTREEGDENVESLQWWTMNKFRSEKLTWAFGSGELNTQKFLWFKIMSYYFGCIHNNYYHLKLLNMHCAFQY